MKSSSELFKRKHFEAEIILLTVRWYLQYRLCYRDLVEMMSERVISIAQIPLLFISKKINADSHSTI